MSEQKEIVICAAIKLPDGFIIRGHRHADCYHNLNGRPKYKGVWKKAEERIIEGFITSRNRFVSRALARHIQDMAGIKSVDPDGYRGVTLYSEDLY